MILNSYITKLSHWLGKVTSAKNTSRCPWTVYLFSLDEMIYGINKIVQYFLVYCTIVHLTVLSTLLEYVILYWIKYSSALSIVLQGHDCSTAKMVCVCKESNTCLWLVQSIEERHILKVLQGPQKPQANMKSLWKNDLKHVSNKMRTLVVLEAIEVQPHCNLLNL